jgi:hypothetical protein
MSNLTRHVRGEDLDVHAWTSKLDNLVLHGRTRFTPGIGVSGFDIVDVRLAWHKDQERYVTAQAGQKITLKEYASTLEKLNSMLTHKTKSRSIFN